MTRYAGLPQSIVRSPTLRKGRHMITDFPSGDLTVLGSAAISIAILILVPNKLPAGEVFGHVRDGSGWNSKGFSFLIGYLSVAWVRDS